MIPPIAERRDADARFDRAMMAKDIEKLTDEVAELRADIKDLVNAWHNANFALAVVKWLGGVIVAVSALWFVVTHFGQTK